ncbi:MAG TPA: methyltransferase domain-containing protein [Candidatus Limnocylindrales bacterium]
MSEASGPRSAAAWRRSLADDLRASGAIRSEPIYNAFAAVSRHLFVPVIYRGRDRILAHLLPDADPSEWESVYRDRTLVTAVDQAGHAVSSSTAPSVMAFMLEALDLRPGLRVLEIGCGTGYNAAVINHITGCEVVTIDPLPPQVAQARKALRRHGVTGVRCGITDGYDGVPEGKPFDRIIVTCAVAGIPPGWLDRCAPGARIVAPLAHGGIDMLVSIDLHADGLVTRPIGGAGYFIRAQGPLYPAARQPAWPRFGAPRIIRPAPVPGFRNGYHDMWFAAAVAEPLVTSVFLEGDDGGLGQCGLADAGSATVLRTDGTVAATGPAAERLAVRGAQLATGWVASGRPRARHWRAILRPDASASPALLVPGPWLRTPENP